MGRSFLDENPTCLLYERYKVVALNHSREHGYRLIYNISYDGIHFRQGSVVTDEGYSSVTGVVQPYGVG